MLCFCHDTSEGEVGFVGVIADCGELRGCWGGVNQPAFRLILPTHSSDAHLPIRTIFECSRGGSPCRRECKHQILQKYGLIREQNRGYEQVY